MDAEAVARRTAYEQQAEKDKQQLLADAQKQADAILAEGKAAAEAERQHKLRQADAQTTALARAMCEKLLARSLNEHRNISFQLVSACTYQPERFIPGTPFPTVRIGESHSVYRLSLIHI